MTARRWFAAITPVAVAIAATSSGHDLVDAVKVEASRAQRDGCRTKACRVRVLWRHYRAHPMPACTWKPESGWDPRTGESFHGRPWALGRYRVVNPSSGAGGKFQFLPSTWRSVGGLGLPQHATRVRQEDLARRLKRRDGTAPWVNC